MKKSLILLIAFCFAFCVLFTACAIKNPQNTNESQSKTESTSDTTETTETEETTTQTTKYTKPYEVCYTRVRETKALQTEAPALQEKIDRNYEAQSYMFKVQNKVVIQIGDQRDVPYIFTVGGGQIFQYEYLFYPYFGGSPSFSEVQKKAADLPTYTYTGTEDVTIELNDEIYSTSSTKREFIVRWMDGEQYMVKDYTTLQEMYNDLPKGTYYVHFLLEIHGNHVYGEQSNYLGLESINVAPVFIVELK